MKIRHKLLAGFFLSAGFAVLVFLFAVYYLLHTGMFSGIDRQQMQESMDCFEEDVKNGVFLKNMEGEKKNVPQMYFSVYQEENGRLTLLFQADPISQTVSLPEILSVKELLSCVEGHSQLNQSYQVSARVISKEETKTVPHNLYLVCLVPNQAFEAMSYSFNPLKVDGVLGKIAVIGLLITFFFTGIFLFFFSWRTRKRVEGFYGEMKKFDLDNPKARIKFKKKKKILFFPVLRPSGSNHKKLDELDSLALHFNQMAEKIEEQFLQKQAYEKERQVLVSNISHDLRTPLSSIVGYSEMLRDGIYDNEEEEKKYIEVIYRKADYMNRLLGELLEFSRLELGRKTLKKEKFDLAEFIRELLIEYVPVLDEQECSLNVELPGHAVFGSWDKDAVGRILRNLLDNALKYGMDGKRLKVSLLEPEGQMLLIEVRDYGKGMPEQVKEHIFEQFYRADTARNSRAGGMGLGLFIAGGMAGQHGGRLEAESREGEGTAMRVWLPYA